MSYYTKKKNFFFAHEKAKFITVNINLEFFWCLSVENTAKKKKEIYKIC